MKRTADVLSEKTLVLIFAYAPAGLGHLRVTDALYGGLPEGVTPLLLGSQDEGIKNVHRILSIHPFLRFAFEWGQRGNQQYPLMGIYRWWLRRKTKLIYQEMRTLLDQRITIPETVLVVATHFGLAHQLASVKQKLEEEKKVRIVLAVQVTDDSPQPIWYVPGADIIFVPSQYTKEKLEQYGKNYNLPPVNIKVIPYPISPPLAEKLSDSAYTEREFQVDMNSRSQIHVCIPISGAAVGLEYVSKMVDALYIKSHRFIFHIVTRSAPYTLMFLRNMIERRFIKLYVSAQDREVVNTYEHIYDKYRILLEITKPSEQAFKSLLHPNQVGGSLLLFSAPVGKQEYDNIDFLQRHYLIPNDSDNVYLWERARKNLDLKTEKGEKLLELATNWRGLQLPVDPDEAACFIWWCFKQGIFKRMLTSHVQSKPSDMHELEIQPNGVKLFWDNVAQYIALEESSC